MAERKSITMEQLIQEMQTNGEKIKEIEVTLKELEAENQKRREQKFQTLIREMRGLIMVRAKFSEMEPFTINMKEVEYMGVKVFVSANSLEITGISQGDSDGKFLLNVYMEKESSDPDFKQIVTEPDFDMKRLVMKIKQGFVREAERASEARIKALEEQCAAIRSQNERY